MNIDLLGQSFCLAKAGLVEGTNANTFRINAPNGAGVDFVIDGVLYHKADTDNIAFTAGTNIGHASLARSCLILVQIDSAGTVSTKQGNIEVTGSKIPLVWPMADKDKCALGGVRVDVTATNSFTPGSTDLSAAGVTDTWYDFFSNPVGAVPA